MRRRPLLVGLLLLAAALLVRLPYFDESLWYDEVWYTHVMLDEEPLERVLFHDVHPPLYPLLMKGWIEAFGDGEIAVRLPSLLFGLASLGLVFALARAWFGRRTALLATVLTAFSPVHIWHSQEAKNNMLLLLLTLLTAYGVWRAWTQGRPRDWLLFVVSASLGLWTNHFALWIVLSAFLWLCLQLARGGRRRSWRWVAGSGVAVALAYLPPLWLVLRDPGAMVREHLRPFGVAEAYELFLVYLAHGNTLRTVSPYEPFQRILEQPRGLFLIDGLFALLLGAGLLLALRRWLGRRKQAGGPPAPGAEGIELLLLYLLVPPIALLVASCFYPRIYIERSMIILLPPFAILISHAVMSLPRPGWRAAAAAVLLGLNAVALANLWVIKRDAWTVYKPNPDWRAFARDLRDDAGGTVVFTGCQSLALQYYLRDSGSVAIWLGSDRDAGRRALVPRTRRLLRRRGIGHPQHFYVAINRYWGGDGALELAQRVFGGSYPLLEEDRYFGLDVYKYGPAR